MTPMTSRITRITIGAVVALAISAPVSAAPFKGGINIDDKDVPDKAITADIVGRVLFEGCEGDFVAGPVVLGAYTQEAKPGIEPSYSTTATKTSGNGWEYEFSDVVIGFPDDRPSGGFDLEVVVTTAPGLCLTEEGAPVLLPVGNWETTTAPWLARAEDVKNDTIDMGTHTMTWVRSPWVVVDGQLIVDPDQFDGL